MALSQQDFENAYDVAMQKWAREQLANVGAIWSGDQIRAHQYLYNENGAGISMRHQAWQDYQSDPASWVHRASQGNAEYPQVAANIANQVDPALRDQQDQQNNAAAQTSQATQLMKQFAQYMMDPNSTNLNDPYVRQVVDAARTQSQQDASSRGLQGAYSVAGAETSAMRAQTAIQAQRQQLGLQALNSAAGIDLGQAQLQQQAYNQMYQAQMQQMQAGYAQQQGNAQGVGGIIGGGIGGVVGGYFGGPAGAQAGFTAGSKVGGGIGGMTVGPMPTMNYTPPSLGYGSNSGSGRGGY